jgi:hypothetical protein
MIHAHGALRDNNDDCPINGEFAFIISAVGSDVKEYKRTILQELGRLEDNDLIRAVAGEICKNKLSTSRAITYIRRHRMENQAEGDALNLAVAIKKMLKEYSRKHSGVTSELMLTSLGIVSDVVSENVSNIIE